MPSPLISPPATVHRSSLRSWCPPAALFSHRAAIAICSPRAAALFSHRAAALFATGHDRQPSPNHSSSPIHRQPHRPITAPELWMQGFRKVDPDRWEFANEEFLGGQKHLLKNIRRRRNVGQASQHSPPQGNGACVELDQFGLETEVERLRADRNVLMLEIVRLRQQQQQQSSRAQLLAMEERIQGTERRQQQTMGFLARALKQPSFIQQLVLRSEQRRQLGDGSKKRRPLMDSDSFSSSRDQETKGVLSESIDENSGAAATDFTWEELLDEGLLMGIEKEGGEQPEIEAPATGPIKWGKDVGDLVKQMVFLGSKPT